MLLIGKIGANLEGSNLNKTEVTNSDLRGTNLQKTNVDLASLEKQTNWVNGSILPDGNIAIPNNPRVFERLPATGDFPISDDSCPSRTDFKNNPKFAK